VPAAFDGAESFSLHRRGKQRHAVQLIRHREAMFQEGGDDRARLTRCPRERFWDVPFWSVNHKYAV
jgi:hypothetical protein